MAKVHACLKVWHLMSKAELVAAVQKALGKEATSAQAERAVDAVIEGIKIGVKKTKSVQLVGFGTFKIATRKARMGVNPKTGEKIKIKARKMVKFVPGKHSKKSCNRGRTAGAELSELIAPGRRDRAESSQRSGREVT